MEKSGFFNSSNGDRIYSAVDFASYFGDLVGNGVFRNTGDSLRVTAVSGMNIAALTGSGWINGYHYQNTMPLELTVPTAHGVNPRIDRVVLRWDNVARAINLAVKAGVPASVPTPPDLARNADIYELSIADVFVERGAISIAPENITDTRMNPAVCGWVNTFDGLDEIIEDIQRDIGYLPDLETEVRSNLVNAINELKYRMDTFSPAPEVTNVPLIGGGNVIIDGSSASIENNGSSRYLRIHGQCQINNIGSAGTHQIWQLPPLANVVTSLHTNGEHVIIGATSELIKVRIIDGEIEWRKTIPHGVQEAKVSMQGNVYVLTNSQEPFIYKLSGDGETIWTINNAIVGGTQTRFTTTDFALDNNETLYCIEGYVPATGASGAICSIITPGGSRTMEDLTPYFIPNAKLSPPGNMSWGLVLDSSNRLFFFAGIGNESATNARALLATLRRNSGSNFTNFGAIQYRTGLIFGNNLYLTLLEPIVVRRFNLNGGVISTLPMTHNLHLRIDIDENGHLHFPSVDGKSVMKLNVDANIQSTVFTFPGDASILRLVCAGAGQYYVEMTDRSIRGLRTGFEPFTSSRFESKKLMGFEQPVPISNPIPIRGTPNLEALGHWGQYELEIRADGVYTVASSTQTIPGNARIMFDGVFLLTGDAGGLAQPNETEVALGLSGTPHGKLETGENIIAFKTL